MRETSDPKEEARERIRALFRIQEYRMFLLTVSLLIGAALLARLDMLEYACFAGVFGLMAIGCRAASLWVLGSLQ